LKEESLVDVSLGSVAAFQSILGTTPQQHFIVVSAAYGNPLFGSIITSLKEAHIRKVKWHIDSKMLS